MSMEPSYLYCGLDAETLAMARELEGLGGGDACLESMEVHAIIDDRLVKGDAQTLWLHGKTVGLRNALLPRTHPEAETMSYFTVTSSLRLPQMLSTRPSLPAPHNYGHAAAAPDIPLCADVADFALRGFNACVLAIGAGRAGKTLALYGPCPPPAHSAPHHGSRRGGGGEREGEGHGVRSSRTPLPPTR